MDILVLVGRILFALPFLAFGANHLLKTPYMAGYAESKGLPAAKATTILSGVLLVVGGLSVLLGVWADLGLLLLLVFLIPTTLVMHAFWRESTPDGRQAEMTQFLKNVGLTGAALALLAFVSFTGDELGLTVTGPLFSMD
ncbi:MULTISPECIES: DoxX family protein [Streptomyces]|jgi:DoxX.|uniref:DoxX n=1 Tax=Streptomyces rubrolavendulae TaxID=285473 RepID=A0A1D8G8C5_9ACTN|nr:MULTISPECIES: DoxX family protein [Streptomyces]AOT61697.1 DoxX [Streptomyces rubrolavendulae]UQS29450.1 DoxX family protein [Streptomyces fradiae]